MINKIALYSNKFMAHSIFQVLRILTGSPEKVHQQLANPSRQHMVNK